MVGLIVRRVLSLIPLWFSITFLVFLLLHWAPGDPAEILLRKEGIEPTQEALEEARRRLGLDQPLPLQYGRWLFRLFQLDLGLSYKTGEPVIQELLTRLPATLELTLASFGVIVFLSLTVGLLSAMRSGGGLDQVGILFAILGASIPSFWLGLLLIYLFSIHLGWLPVMGRGDFGHLVLPALTLGLGTAMIQGRLLRTSLIQVLGKDFIKTAMAKGLSRRRILLRHALPNALLPILTTLGMVLGRLLGGAVIVETIFSWPGLGRLAIEAILQRDYPILMGYVLLTASLFLFINLCVDIGYRFLDPRIEFDPRS
ncbi:MAG: ABC transporter permease [Desulfobacterota bacterium]|nr:ABC transporter permease [Thermodesulfobacteriota bacterium]